MKVLIIVLVVAVVLVLLGLAMGGQDRQAVRAWRAVPVRPGAGTAEPRIPADHPVHRRAAPGVAADRDDADPVPGHHHPRQRERRRVRRRLLPRGGRGTGSSRSRTSAPPSTRSPTTRLRRRSLRFPPSSCRRKAQDQAGNDPQVGHGRYRRSVHDGSWRTSRWAGTLPCCSSRKVPLCSGWISAPANATVILSSRCAGSLTW